MNKKKLKKLKRKIKDLICTIFEKTLIGITAVLLLFHY